LPGTTLRTGTFSEARETRAPEARMHPWTDAGRSALVSGTIASIATTAALALLARAQGKRALQPTNATSHWLHGEGAGGYRRADIAHTLLGYATHHASAIFWALPFQRWLARPGPHPPHIILRDAAAMAAIAAFVDYALVPKRLTPGWEEVLPKRSIVAVYGVLALALAAGAMIAQERQSRP
jgi:hypothetical protein